MLLPATHFHFPPPPSSSSPLLFPLHQFPKSKPRFRIRCSSSDTQTLPDSAIQRIAHKLRSLGITDQPPAPPSSSSDAPAAASPGEIFVPLPHHLPKPRVGHTVETSWSNASQQKEKTTVTTVTKKKKKREEQAPTLAELSLSDAEIRRLTTLGLGMKQKLKVGKAGITEGIVNGVHERWRSSEVVRIICEDLSRFNMKRTHDLLERKTGGLVVWRSGSKIILYRGTDYKYPYFLSDKVLRDEKTIDALGRMDEDERNSEERQSHSSEMKLVTTAQNSNVKTAKPTLIQGVGTPNKVRFQLPGEAELAEDADGLLTGLGPRFIDWWGYDPLPVDADLLPAVIPGYRKPFRLLPYGVKPKLTDDEMTTLRRLGKHLPYHFALGRNSKLQGLAAAIIKLWERCEIVKIAIKRDVQDNTNSELMAEEIKRLTGGSLLARDKEFIVFYRGKDFLPAAVSSAIEQRRNIGMYNQKTRNNSSDTAIPDLKHGVVESDSKGNDMILQKDITQVKLTKVDAAIKSTSVKLSMALEKKAMAEKLLEELENGGSSQESEINKEGITTQEKYMLRRIGLKMKPFLLLGRRGAFDGTVENMHLHWKYRELVKIICRHGSLEDVYQIAQTLEVESGGILVAVERVNKGHAIIVYRGKNYSRPASLRPKTLLNKKQAWKRYTEAQRYESLKLHVLKLDKNISDLKLQMVKDMEANSEVTPVDNQHAIQEQPVELIDGGGAHQGEPDSIDWNSPKEASVDNQQVILEQPADLIDGAGAHQSEPESSIYWNSPKEDSVDNQHVIQEQLVELIDDGGAHEGEPESSIDWNAPKETTIVNQKAIRDQPVELIDSCDALQGGPGNSINWNWNAPKEDSVDNHQAILGQPVELMDRRTHQGEPESWSGLIHKETKLHKYDDSMVDTDHRIFNSKVMESSFRASQTNLEPSDSVTDMSSNKLHSRLSLSNRERLLLRKQALTMKKRPVIAIGKSNTVTGVAKTIKDHFKKYPLAIVNVKGRAKGTSVQELVFKLEQATGAVLVSQEPNKVILYRGWGEGEQPSTALNAYKTGKERETKPSVSPELLEAIRVECGLQ